MANTYTFYTGLEFVSIIPIAIKSLQAATARCRLLLPVVSHKQAGGWSPSSNYSALCAFLRSMCSCALVCARACVYRPD